MVRVPLDFEDHAAARTARLVQRSFVIGMIGLGALVVFLPSPARWFFAFCLVYNGVTTVLVGRRVRASAVSGRISADLLEVRLADGRRLSLPWSSIERAEHRGSRLRVVPRNGPWFTVPGGETATGSQIIQSLRVVGIESSDRRSD
jgi:hypothetical protein